MEDQARTRNPRILVVEDDQSVRRMLRFSLRDAGFDIFEVSTGAEALRTLQEGDTEAIILDLGLPDGLGGKVLEWLRRSEASQDSHPVWVVISAQDQNEVARKYGPMGQRFMSKPFNPWDLVTRLQDLLAARGNLQSG